MNKICLSFATLLLGSSLTYGGDALIRIESSSPPASGSSSSLTPKRIKGFSPVDKGAIRQASLTAQFDSIANDSPSGTVSETPEIPAADPIVAEPSAEFSVPAAPEIAPQEVQQAVPQEIPASSAFEPVSAAPETNSAPQPGLPEPVIPAPAAQTPVVQEEPVQIEIQEQQPVAVQPEAVQPVEPAVQTSVVQEDMEVKVPVIQVPQTIEQPAAQPSQDAYAFIYSELEQFRNELAQIKKDTAKPDTKKGWSAPKISGRIFLDSVNFMDSTKDFENAAGFRELRIGAAGTGYDSFDYKIEFGFNDSSGSVTLMDNWIGVKNVPLLGYFRAGYYKPEAGLYYPMGTTNVSMMEYTTAANVFGLSRRVGVSSEHLFANDRVRLFLGLFQNSIRDRNVTNDDQGQIVNLRVTAAPVFEQEGRQLLHFGGHWEYVNTSSDSSNTAQLSAKPGTFSWAGNSLSSGSFANDHSNRGGFEVAYQNGAFSARSEFMAGSFAAYNEAPKRSLLSAYVELGIFLSDAFRTYDLKTGAFGAVKMKENFHPFAYGDWNLVDGFGVWQAVFQWSYTDMTDWEDNTESAGDQTDITLGLNWFWSPQMRWIFEYVHSEQTLGVANSHASQDIFGTSIRYNW